MPESVEENDILSVLQWIGTTLEKNNDVLMTILGHHDNEMAEFVDFVHNQKYVFLNEQSKQQVAVLFEEYRKYEQEQDDRPVVEPNN